MNESMSEAVASLMAIANPLPDHLAPSWGNRVDDPRDSPVFCEKQSRKTPAIPWHNGSNVCLSCGKDVRPLLKP